MQLELLNRKAAAIYDEKYGFARNQRLSVISEEAASVCSNDIDATQPSKPSASKHLIQTCLTIPVVPMSVQNQIYFATLTQQKATGPAYHLSATKKLK